MQRRPQQPVAVAYIVFQSIGGNLHDFVENRVPESRQSTALLVSADELRDALAEILIANNTDALDTTEEKIATSVQKTADIIENRPSASRETLAPLLGDARERLGGLIAARRSEFESLERIEASIASLEALSAEAASTFIEGTDSAYFEMVLGGEDTVNSVNSAFAQLVEDDFSALQTVLQTRAEINLLTSISLAMAESRDPDMRPILQDLINSANTKLEALIPELVGRDGTAELATTVEEILSTTGNGAIVRRNPSELLSLRQEADNAAVSAIDDQVFDLIMRSEEVSYGTEAAITDLIEGEVTRMRELDSLGTAANAVVIAALQAALAPTIDNVAFLQGTLITAASDLSRRAEGEAPEIVELLSQIIAVADPQTGMAAMRLSMLTARNDAADAARQAADSVRTIAREAERSGQSAVEQISATAIDLSGRVGSAGLIIAGIGGVGLVLLIVVPVFVWKSVVLPLRQITETTERLAGGNLDPVVGFEKTSGEIARMANALRVFRDGMIERIKLQEDEKAREIAMQEKTRRDEKLAREREEEERRRMVELEQRQAREKRELEKAEAARREEMRAAADAERQAAAAEQAKVVETLAPGAEAACLRESERQDRVVFWRGL